MSVVHTSKLKRLIKDGSLYISPILSDTQVGEVAVDLRLGNVALFVRAAGLSHVDPETYMTAESQGHRHQIVRRQKFERHEFQFGKPILIHPGSLTLVPTLEWVALPLTLKGVVTARSSWAREGLNIATANFINPGYTGVITLELANFGQIPIALYAGMRIAQIAFHEVARARATAPTRRSQFDLSFEPRAGEITRHDEAFINVSNRRTQVRLRLERAQRVIQAGGAMDSGSGLTGDLADAFPPSVARDCVTKTCRAANNKRTKPHKLELLIGEALRAISAFDGGA